ncbi:MAG: MqnA/MqnD/SBP family protein [Candidatus Giovannonibacteria bacterium]|nr:MqnA/MqnD/SBP family protein [Candidatus Giovannonibacteria bacterium]
MNIKKPILIIAAIIIVIVAFWGFQVLKPPETRKVSATFSNEGVSAILQYTIEQLSLDKKHGLDLVSVKGDPGELERKLRNREVDIGGQSTAALIKSNQEGFNIKIFAPYLTFSNSLLVKTDANYQSIDDLKGKKIGIVPKQSALYQTAALEFRILGVNLEKDFKLSFGGQSDLVEFLKKGEVDAAFVTTPLAAILVASGDYREVLDMGDLWVSIYGVPYFFLGRAAHADWLEKNKDIAKSFTAMSLEAAKYILDHPEFVAKYAREALNAKTQGEIDFLVKRLPKALPTSWDNKMIDNAVFVMQKAAEFGFIDKIPANSKEFFTQF